MKTKNDYNELRCYANEIMHQLYQAGEIGQLELLVNYGNSAVSHIKAEIKSGRRNEKGEMLP